MQKTPLSQMIREELIRASILAIGFGVMVGAGTVSVAYAANSGGEFGRILNLILLKSWDDPTNDGTVKNADKLG
jgi:H+/Cl- antiporter ClcA